MRTEKEMFDLILSVANNDERIRAVYMNGSRANPNVIKDIYQDYDIVYVVTKTEWFLENKNWISVFGDLAIVQEPDSNDFGWGINMDFTRSYTWLMLFKDGVRIDLKIQIKNEMLKRYICDSLTVPLLDKDSCLPKIPESSDKGYFVKEPSLAQYKGCCNEFWWCLQNVAKGIARDQLPYAMWMYNVIVRNMLEKMIDWYIGINTGFSVTVGMRGKYYKKYLPENLYSLYTKTYSGSDYDDFWTAILNACELFRTIVPPVGRYFGFIYNLDEDINMTEYLNWVKASCKNGIDGFNQNSDELRKASEIKLACFDLDHTLIYGVHSVLFPCLINGKYREARLIDEKEEKGLMNWIDADFERAKLIQGLNVACLKENFDMILTPIRNIKRTISELQGKGIKCILITAGPVQVAKVAAEKWGFDGYYGSLYEEKNGTFTGKIIKHTGDEGKLSCLIEYCNKYSIMPEECVAIGDGSTDIPIFAYCGKSIAINYSDSMIGKAKYYLKTDDLSDLLLSDIL